MVHFFTKPTQKLQQQLGYRGMNIVIIFMWQWNLEKEQKGLGLKKNLKQNLKEAEKL